MIEIRNMRRNNSPKQDKFRLEGEDMREDRELRNYAITSIAHQLSKINAEDIINGQATARPDPDSQKALEGRTSGNAQWIRSRGEQGRNTPGQDPHNQHPR